MGRLLTNRCKLELKNSANILEIELKVAVKI